MCNMAGGSVSSRHAEPIRCPRPLALVLRRPVSAEVEITVLTLYGLALHAEA